MISSENEYLSEEYYCKNRIKKKPVGAGFPVNAKV